jgi:hypothetical protein
MWPTPQNPLDERPGRRTSLKGRRGGQCRFRRSERVRADPQTMRPKVVQLGRLAGFATASSFPRFARRDPGADQLLVAALWFVARVGPRHTLRA